MGIISLNNKLEEFVVKNNLLDDAAAFKKECAISSSAEWQKVLDEFAENERVLRIGIVGRVKAGKSSMLNALLFDGQDILPKAATPMTAALTVMKYSEKVHADVDFYTRQDIDEIKKKYEQYKLKLKELTEKHFKDNQERALRRGNKQEQQQTDSKDNSPQKRGRTRVLTSDEINDCKNRAIKMAEGEMKNDANYASFDQYSRIEKSGKSLENLQQYESIPADSEEALMEKLNDFVGSSGTFMPFTKSVTLHIPQPSLQGLEIIDTPGVNDPVTSRGERTEELLKHCDVVLVVSPAGQFLNTEDTDLLQRITTQEGAQEAYLIASQVDNQLFGSEKGHSTNPEEVLGSVSYKLTSHARDVLQRLSQQYPEMKPAADKLNTNDVICSSSVAYTMDRYFNQQASWDSNLQHVWSNLSHHYPEFFGESDKAQDTLKKLANIERLHGVIKEVTERKVEILQKRRIDFEEAQHRNLQKYWGKLNARIIDQVDRIKNGDSEELKKQKVELDKQRETILLRIGDVYEDLVIEVQRDLDKKMKDQLTEQLRQYENVSESAQGTEQRSEEVYKGKKLGFLWKTYETRHYEVTKVRATAIRRAIEDIRAQLEDNLEGTAIDFQLTWKKGIYNKIVSNMREILGDDELDFNLIVRVVKNIIARIPESSFSLPDDLPQELKKSGTLTDSAADKFLAAADNYMSSLKEDVRSSIKAYISVLVSNLKAIKLAEELTNDLQKAIEQLVSDIENKEISLLRYQRMQDELAALE